MRIEGIFWHEVCEYDHVLKAQWMLCILLHQHREERYWSTKKFLFDLAMEEKFFFEWSLVRSINILNLKKKISVKYGLGYGNLYTWLPKISPASS